MRLNEIEASIIRRRPWPHAVIFDMDGLMYRTEQMIREAESLGADAVIGVRYATSSIMQSAAEVTVYGTAVKYR